MEKFSTADSFPFFRFQVLLYERNFAEAERLSLSQWQGKDEGLVRYFAFYSAMASRARGDVTTTQAYLQTTRRAYESALHAESPDANVFCYVGVIDVALGRKDEGLGEIRKATEMRPISRDALQGPEYSTFLAQAYLWAGERDLAIEQLASVVNVPNGPTFGDLKLDPGWDQLRDHPRLAQLLAEAAKPIPVQIVK